MRAGPIVAPVAGTPRRSRLHGPARLGFQGSPSGGRLRLADVFISYTRADRHVAARFARALEAAGLSVWWDAAVRTGNTFDEQTEAELRAARAVLVLWSPRATASRWVRSEASVALRLETLVPVMIAPCERPVMFELMQTADMTSWTGDPDDPVFRQLLAEVRAIIGHLHPPAESGPAPVRPPPELPSLPSIAVLPFTDLSGGEDFFADGLTEEISTLLSGFSGLFVISARSGLSYRGSAKPPRVIAAELGVRYLLDGSVRRAGAGVRVSARLTDAIEGTQVWAKRFDEQEDDLFELHDRIAEAVAGSIDSRLANVEIEKASRSPNRQWRPTPATPGQRRSPPRPAASCSCRAGTPSPRRSAPRRTTMRGGRSEWPPTTSSCWRSRPGSR